MRLAAPPGPPARAGRSAGPRNSGQGLTRVLGPSRTAGFRLDFRTVLPVSNDGPCLSAETAPPCLSRSAMYSAVSVASISRPKAASIFCVNSSSPLRQLCACSRWCRAVAKSDRMRSSLSPFRLRPACGRDACQSGNETVRSLVNQGSRWRIALLGFFVRVLERQRAEDDRLDHSGRGSGRREQLCGGSPTSLGIFADESCLAGNWSGGSSPRPSPSGLFDRCRRLMFWPMQRRLRHLWRDPPYRAAIRLRRLGVALRTRSFVISTGHR